MTETLDAPRVRHPRLAALVRDRYRPEDVTALADVLRDFGSFDLHPHPNGLYAAVPRRAPGTDETGYHRCWVRDTVHVANVAWEAGRLGDTRRTAASLLQWFETQRPRFVACSEGRADLADKMQRPQIRFDIDTITEVDERWPHIQNDALGYGLWFLARAALAGLLPSDARTASVLALFPVYFRAVAYWRDADSGHWEEQRRVQASSVGAVVAGLRSLAGLAASAERKSPGAGLAFTGGVDLESLAHMGRLTLEAFLPWETRGYDDDRTNRRVDAAQLFLIHPLRVVDDEMAGRLATRVRQRLLGPHGIRRYVGDSYWMADYKRLFDAETRTSGFDDDVDARDRHLLRGTEAQWCLFDPLLSTIHGFRYLASRDPAERELQLWHLHRALAQVTPPGCPLGEGLCPEAYYLADSSRPHEWVPNDDTPLLWTQAMLVQALMALERTAGIDA